jgi:hypothetical protein
VQAPENQKRSRRRKGRGRAAVRPSPASSEELVRAETKLDRSDLTAVSDGRTLEGVIGELQSTWGVPQNPQEYRITLKVAEEREGRGERVAIEEVREEVPVKRKAAGDQPRREKAPAAPRIGSGMAGAEPDEPAAPLRRKRARRRRRRGRPQA